MPDIVALDTAYSEDTAHTAGVLIHRWDAVEPVATYCTDSPIVAEYVPGQFFKRELPPILHFLATVPWRPELIVIDGYVSLGATKKGLGLHLYEALGMTVPIVGVAKRSYANNETAETIFRGKSNSPLFVTASGIDVREAAQNILSMAGAYRIPTLLKAVDTLSRSAMQSCPV